MTELDIKNLFKKKFQNKEFKFDKRTNQKFIEIVNANFISETGFIVYHNHDVTDEQWYVDNYEPLMWDKIDYVVNKIKEDPDTRQAYIAMLYPDKYYNDDKICTIGMQIIYHKDSKTVDYIVNMRSNNACEYTMDSLWQCKIFTIIVNRLISELDNDIRPGYLYWNAASLHLYEEDFKFLSDNTKIADEIKYALSIFNRLSNNVKQDRISPKYLLPKSESPKVHFIDFDEL